MYVNRMSDVSFLMLEKRKKISTIFAIIILNVFSFIFLTVSQTSANNRNSLRKLIF